ncbi:metal ABC transporter ATP-binding protein [Staphylococcus pseudintermedius]|uniref:metal ABC transporter ATP-binding protein n=1 Tax=Staphylococcus pseudintermedius TaxID=283734 RepID=UPI000F71F95E|nr:metal ABC transporter ATP-binding protein [Staphylococcus pseudintermedius]EGQ1585588.1 metal ABC transporter ATP-binding protein [Staphylococcus pseudintermedius]EGQ1771276.1 metal ABC transporter ATP-binding protein [Staphylococcus pseudintermedius]EGQ2905333.1 ATP-binding cassette domain-containing protein [Staphylococcus pseudintermedius]EGQ3316796.1 metal ABC transporter ATP-binding protein [Staphylococcus pseudintermedius]EGQ3390917.1 metal ABC transporter ATP-binding protein [Staphyl
MLSIENLNLHLGQKHVLKNISLDLPFNGEMIGIMGPNGSGKSSLIKSIIGELPAKGKVTLNQQPAKQQLTNMTYIPQKSVLDLDFPINVQDLVLTGCYQEIGWFRRVPKAIREKRDTLLKELELYELRKRQLHALSGGQLQRVFIARALMSDSLVYLLDEPFVGIDFKSERIIFEKLQYLKQQGKLILIVHHDLSTAGQYFDRILLLNQSIAFLGDSAEALQPKNIESVFLSRYHQAKKDTPLHRKESAQHVVRSTPL